MSVFRIDSLTLGRSSTPVIVAEMSGYHNQSLDRALAIVDAAAEAGAHAVKLQTYTPDTMTLDLRSGEFLIDDAGSPWRGYSLYDLYKTAHTPWDWHEAIFRRCRRYNMACFSTPFDPSAVDFLETLGNPCYKIASFEITDLHLIRKAASTGKPLILSTGMATMEEIGEAVREARRAGDGGVLLLKCTSSYPAPPGESNIRTLEDLRSRFDVEVGISDHTVGIGTAIAAVALGAVLIEKHFTLNRADGGVDASFSLEPGELRCLVDETRRAWESLGVVRYGPTVGETPSLRFRRSLYFSRALERGAIISPGDVRSIRPGYGLPPKYLDRVLGMRLRSPVAPGIPVRWDLLEDTGKNAPFPGADGGKQGGREP